MPLHVRATSHSLQQHGRGPPPLRNLPPPPRSCTQARACSPSAAGGAIPMTCAARRHRFASDDDTRTRQAAVRHHDRLPFVALSIGLAVWVGGDVFSRSARVALPFTLVAALATGRFGHAQGMLMDEQQPMKMAAAEALYNTQKGASFSIFAAGRSKSTRSTCSLTSASRTRSRSSRRERGTVK